MCTMYRLMVDTRDIEMNKTNVKPRVFHQDRHIRINMQIFNLLLFLRPIHVPCDSRQNNLQASYISLHFLGYLSL